MVLRKQVLVFWVLVVLVLAGQAVEADGFLLKYFVEIEMTVFRMLCNRGFVKDPEFCSMAQVSTLEQMVERFDDLKNAKHFGEAIFWFLWTGSPLSPGACKFVSQSASIAAMASAAKCHHG